MTLLNERAWLTKYSPEHCNLVTGFYIPALECAVRYDRSTGYFSAYALALAARGIEGLVHNGGRMRLVVGCTLKPQDLAAIQQGADLRDTVEAALLTEPLGTGDPAAIDALALLAWMVAKGHLDVKVAVPCDEGRKPIAGLGLFHEKAGIVEDGAGNRLAFCGSINETEFGWKHNWESFHVYTTWTGGTAHVQAEEESFARLWADRATCAIVMDVPAAVRLELLKFLPKDDVPGRLKRPHADVEPPTGPAPITVNWPIYDGQRLCWLQSPGLQGEAQRLVGPRDWHREPYVLASSHLMRRRDRAAELLAGAEPWDLVVLDEAHHARRAGGGLGTDQRPNQLLRLMQALRERTAGLVLLTATPMQVSPIEVWDSKPPSARRRCG